MTFPGAFAHNGANGVRRPFYGPVRAGAVVEVGNFWWQSLDYVNRSGSLNSHQAVKSSDGRYRLVIAHEDPGVPNWLDPGGYSEGMILYRYQQSKTAPRPTLELVPASELAKHLPADTKQVSSEERRAEIARRRDHAARRWSP